MIIMLTESVLEKLHLPKSLFFAVRGTFPILLMINMMLVFIMRNQLQDNTPHFVSLLFNLIIALKLIFTLLIICTDPGTIKKDSKIEKYFKNNRKDLANVKAPMGLGTFPLRSNF
jgi:hypothetical protein